MRLTRLALTLTTALVILFLGCHHAAIAYVLRRDGLDPVVFPPARDGNASQVLSVAIKRVRKTTAKRDCDIQGDLISLRWQGTTAEVSFHSQEFFAISADQSPNQVGRGMYLDPLLAIDKFRSILAERQAEGCLRRIENESLRRAIAEHVPFPPAIAYFLPM